MYWVKKQQHDFKNDPCGAAELISVIIPVYGKKLAPIVETLRSLRQQSSVQLEIIIVSNGVSEGSFKALGILAGRDIKIVYLGKNMGAAFARNAGVKVAKGEVLWFVDSDVYGVNPDAGRLALEHLKQDGQIGSLGGVIFHGDDGCSFVGGRIRDEFTGTYSHSGKLLDDDFVNTACVFVRRSVFNTINGFADYIEYPFDDVDFGFKVRSAGFRCVGCFECSGLHPLYSPSDNFFYTFMTMHNLLLHLFISYNPATFRALLRKKREMKWRMAPPSKKAAQISRVKPMINKLFGLFLAAGWLLIHLVLVLKLRVERQRYIHSFGDIQVFA
ncbi:MAG: glycosyltransferase [Candidatus Omnitrophica bacterium]|nr:glycosyltransferase [Candidatus Omnitrophota bacterium]